MTQLASFVLVFASIGFSLINATQVLNNKYCLKFDNIPGITLQEVRTVLPGILYDYSPKKPFVENCDDPDAVGVYVREGGRYSIPERNISSRFRGDDILHVWVSDSTIVLRNKNDFQYGPRTRMNILDSRGTLRGDWCFLQQNTRPKDSCENCIYSLATIYNHGECRVNTIGFAEVLAAPITRHYADGIVLSRIGLRYFNSRVKKSGRTNDSIVRRTIEYDGEDYGYGTIDDTLVQETIQNYFDDVAGYDDRIIEYTSGTDDIDEDFVTLRMSTDM